MALPSIKPYPLPRLTDLAQPRAPWGAQRDRLALLVHDMQEYFCAPFAQDQSPLTGVVANIAHLLQAARTAGIPVFYTAQKGDQFPADRGLQRDLWGPGMSARPEHEAILPPLAPRTGDHVLVKHRYSAFQRSNLADLMQARGRDQLMITGIYAHIGCMATAAEAFQRDIQPFPVCDAQADFDRTRHDMAMNWVAACCGVPLDTESALQVMTREDA